MVSRLHWFASGAVLVVGLLFSVAGLSAPKTTPKQQARIKRGEYLVQLGGCGDCHTPMKFDQALGVPVPDQSRRLSGHPSDAPDPGGTLGQGDQAVIGPTFTAFKVPFGTVYASNITSDRDTGLGSWNEDAFIRTMRTGRHFGSGRVILPPMPWMNLAAATDEDLRAIFAYLQSTPPVRNQVPANKVDAKAVAALEKAYEQMSKAHAKQK